MTVPKKATIGGIVLGIIAGLLLSRFGFDERIYIVIGIWVGMVGGILLAAKGYHRG